MSLFKVNRGNESNLPSKLTDGWAYFCTDTGSFLIDHYDSTNTLVRSKINAEYADKLRYVQNEEPIDAPEGTLWIDLDAEGAGENGEISVFIDTTLTQSGQAADAKAVGDALATKQPVGNYVTVDQVNTKVSYGEPQDLTPEQQAQARENIGAVSEDDFKSVVTVVEIPVNINDEVYDNAHFGANSVDIWDRNMSYGLMSANYLPVTGGRTIEAIYGYNAFGECTMRVVQYNKDKEKIVDAMQLRPKISRGVPTSDNNIPKQLILNEETAFIRFSLSHYNNTIIIDGTEITLAYIEDAVTDYIDHSVRKKQNYVSRHDILTYEFDNLELLKTCLTLKANDYCETKGYHYYSDGGGAKYKIVSEVDETTHQEPISNGLYATLLFEDKVNVKQFGAVGDGIADDTMAIQAAIQTAINNGKNIIMPEGNYLTSSPIEIADTINIDAEDANIKYIGTEYAIIVTRFDNGNLRFGHITSDNGGCIKLDSSNFYIQYLNLEWLSMKAKTNCVYCYSPEGDLSWVNEIRFYNGRFQSGECGVYADALGHLTCSGFRFFNVGVEGVDLGFYLANGVADWHIMMARQAEAKLLIKTVGNVGYITIIGANVVGTPMLDISDQTRHMRIDGTIAYGENYETLGHNLLVDRGIHRILNPYDRHVNIYNRGLFDMTTFDDLTFYQNFGTGGSPTHIKLSRVYGLPFGINEFGIYEASGYPITIEDYNGKIICENLNVGYDSLTRFIWHPSIGWRWYFCDKDDPSHIDSALSSTSTNAVQNKAVYAAIDNLNTIVGDTAVSTQITNAITGLASESYVNNAISQAAQVQIISWEADD